MKRLAIYVLVMAAISGLFSSCETDCDSDIIGLYTANVEGVVSWVDLVVTEVDCGEVRIRAPFDGFDPITINAEVEGGLEAEVTIPEQSLSSTVTISGDGTYNDGLLTLKYSMNFAGETYSYTLNAEK